MLLSIFSSTIFAFILFLGEVHPRSARRPGWIKKVIEICELCLDHGFLPHTNVGPLSKGLEWRVQSLE